MPDTDFAPEIHAAPLAPRSVHDARDAITDTRERISATLDAIEARIEETKDEIRRRADVLRPVRERIVADPWRALAIGAGAGLVLGLLTGGRAEDGRGRRRQRSRSRRERVRARTQDYRPSRPAERHEPESTWREELREIPEKVRDSIPDTVREIPDKLREIPEKVRELPELVSDAAHDVREYAEERLAQPRAGAPMRERFVEHLLHALAGAVTDGVAQRFRRAATD